MAARKELSGLAVLGTLTLDGVGVVATAADILSRLNAAGDNQLTGGLGVGGGSADATNRLVTNGPASLFTHNGSGGHQVKLNKALTADTASFLFQTGFSGRAEFGTLANNDFTLKTSSNGSAWNDAFAVTAGTGVLDFKQAPTYLGQAMYHTGSFAIADYAALTGAAFTGDITNTGVYRGPAGTGALPAFSFSADPDTGVFRAGANQLGLATGGAVRATLTNSALTLAASITSMSGAAVVATFSQLGLGGATPDATNRFSINTPALLLNNAGTSVEMKFNKNALANDAALTFQTGFTTHAIMGLLADNDFTLKVGASFTTAMTVANATGRVSFPAGIKQIQVGTTAPASPAVGDLWVDTN